MSRPPIDPRTRPLADKPTWGRIAASYLLVAAVPFLLWAATAPLLAAATLVGLATAVTGGRHTYRLVQCVRNCAELTVELFGSTRITVTQLPADDACC